MSLTIPQEPSEALAKFQQSFEGISARAYRDSAGVLTIGIGHTNQYISSFSEKSVWDMDRIMEVWRDDLQEAVDDANIWLNVEIEQRHFDMVVDQIFNAGKPRTLLNLLNLGRTDEAAQQLLRWIYYTEDGVHKVAIGLVKRCFARYMYWKGKDWEPFAQCPATSRNVKPLNELIAPLGYRLISDPVHKFRLQRVA